VGCIAVPKGAGQRGNSIDIHKSGCRDAEWAMGAPQTARQQAPSPGWSRLLRMRPSDESIAAWLCLHVRHFLLDNHHHPNTPAYQYGRSSVTLTDSIGQCQTSGLQGEGLQCNKNEARGATTMEN